MTYEQLKAHQIKIGKWPLSKEAVYNLAIAECARAIGMSEKALIALMNKGEWYALDLEAKKGAKVG